MNKQIAELIDKAALYKLHRYRSAKSHFSISSFYKYCTCEDFFKEPSAPEVKYTDAGVLDNYTLGSYSFESQVKGNGISNELATGKLRLSGSKSVPANVILVHGWRMDSLNMLDAIYLRKLQAMGCNIYYFTMPHHFERCSEESLFNGELMISADIDRTLLSVQQAVSDLRALIKHLKSQSDAKVVLIGVSLGGFLTNLTGAFERDIDTLISVFYANSLAYSIWNTIPGKYIKKDFIENGFAFEELKASWSIIAPSGYKPILPKENILLISALYDQYVSIEDSDTLWNAWDKPQRRLYKCGHAGIAICKSKIAEDTYDFIKNLV